MCVSSRIPVLEVDLGPGIHAFFTTREGGASLPPWDSLNLGAAVGDVPAAVRENRSRVDSAAGAAVTYATQVHGSAVVLVPDAGSSATGAGEADGLVALGRGVPVGVYVADCVPVLLADPGTGVVAAVHAGRPGVEKGVVLEALRTMEGQGADLASVRAVLGPSICGRCYEVSPDLQSAVVRAEPASRSTTSWGTAALDLPAAVLAQLRRAGVRLVDASGLCTRTDPRFFSHRAATERAADGGDGRTGRFVGVVMATGRAASSGS